MESDVKLDNFHRRQQKIIHTVRLASFDCLEFVSKDSNIFNILGLIYFIQTGLRFKS